jgi:hypothetical protein
MAAHTKRWRDGSERAGKTERIDRIVSDAHEKKLVYVYRYENGLYGFVIPGSYREMAQVHLSVDERGPFALCAED